MSISTIVPIIKARANLYTDDTLAKKSVITGVMPAQLSAVFELVRKVKRRSATLSHDMQVVGRALTDNRTGDKTSQPLDIEVFFKEDMSYAEYQDNYFNATRNGVCFTSNGRQPSTKANLYRIDKVVPVMTNPIHFKDCWSNDQLVKKDELIQRVNNEMDNLLFKGTLAYLAKTQEELFARNGNEFIHFGNLPARSSGTRPSGTFLPLYNRNPVTGEQYFVPDAVSIIQEDARYANIANPLFVGSSVLNKYQGYVNHKGLSVNQYDVATDRLFTNENTAILNAPLNGNMQDNYLAVINTDNLIIDAYAPVDGSLEKANTGKVTKGVVKSPFLGLEWYVTIVFDDCTETFTIQAETVLAVISKKRCFDMSNELYTRGVGGAGFVYTVGCGDINICLNDPIAVTTSARTKTLEACNLEYESCQSSCYMSMTSRQYRDAGVDYTEFIAEYTASHQATYQNNTFVWTVNDTVQTSVGPTFTIPTLMLANQVVRVTQTDSKGCSAEARYPSLKVDCATNLWDFNGVSFDTFVLTNGVYVGNIGTISAFREIEMEAETANNSYTLTEVKNIANVTNVSGSLPADISGSFLLHITVAAGTTTAVFSISTKGICDLPETILVQVNYTIAAV